jgi:hypothetical protein
MCSAISIPNKKDFLYSVLSQREVEKPASFATETTFFAPCPTDETLEAGT